MKTTTFRRRPIRGNGPGAELARLQSGDRSSPELAMGTSEGEGDSALPTAKDATAGRSRMGAHRSPVRVAPLPSADPLAVSDDAAGKPFPNYFGSKDAAGVKEQIIGRFVPHSIYVDACVGGGAVLRAKTPALRTIAIDSNPDVIEAWRRHRWPGVELYQGDVIEFLRAAATWLPADALVYCDPTYPTETRSSRRRYPHELGDDRHPHLLQALQELPCAVYVSTYPNVLYATMLHSWSYAEFPAMTRGGPRTEALYWRSSIASFGVEARYVGRNFRERERIKRKVNRWTGKFTRMPAGERAAVLQSLLDATARASPAPARVATKGALA